MGTRVLATIAAFTAPGRCRSTAGSARAASPRRSPRRSCCSSPASCSSPPSRPSFAYTTADLGRRAEFSATASTVQGDPTAAYFKVLNEIFC